MDDRRVTELTSDLVRIPSVMGNESLVAERIGSEMKALGFDGVETDSLGNILGTICGDKEGPTILLDGHMDTVDIHPASAWSRDPFSGEIVGSRIYGRGATDMKGALASMICAGGQLDRSRLAGKAVISGSVGEESTEGTALKSIIKEIRPDFIIIGEPSGLKIIRAGRGRAEFILEVRGIPCHASTPDKGLNAILEMQRALSAIESMGMREHSFVGRGVMCVTDIISVPYPAQSVVPSSCRVKYERRLIPGEDEAEVIQQMIDACNLSGIRDYRIRLAEASYRTETGVVLEEKKWYPAWELREDHPFLAPMEKALLSIGIEPVYASYQFCTNAAYTIGRAGIPTIGFGPSTESLAHIVDEYIEISQLVDSQKAYRAMIESFLTKV